MLAIPAGIAALRAWHRIPSRASLGWHSNDAADCARARAGARRLARNALDRDGESAPRRIGMRRDAVDRKHFGEHLGPLYRWLRAQVDRPWSNVYGELCAALDRRSVVQAHLFQHIEDRVVTDAVWLEGQVWSRGWRGLAPIAQSHAEMFVHPRTGILLRNRAREKAAHQRRLERAASAREQSAERRLSPPGRPADRQWHRIDGVWYEVSLRMLQPGTAGQYDFVLGRDVGERDADELRRQYGEPVRYCSAKHQLDRRTLRRHALATTA